VSDSDLDRLRLARTEGVGPVAYRRLIRRYGSAEAALDALPDLARAGGRLTEPATPSRSAAERECERLARLGGRFLFVDTPDYPKLLAMLDDPPPAIAVLGRIEALQPRAVALVGGRNATTNGQRLAEHLAQDLATAGLAVVSGLARGIDAAAHNGALASGWTIAVVAGGLDVPYPPEHAGLQRRVAEAGAVIAEMPFGTAPQARHFPRRNRIIAGLSLGVVDYRAHRPGGRARAVCGAGLAA
jgi:DNA processing protein